MMARAYGFVSTSRGVGAVFSLARDYNGEISGSLDFYLQPGHESLSERELRSAMVIFRSYLQRERIIVRELKADNLIYQRLGPAIGRLILIDGVGNNEFLPVANYSVLFARRSLKKRWKKFEDSLLSSYPDNSGWLGGGLWKIYSADFRFFFRRQNSLSSRFIIASVKLVTTVFLAPCALCRAVPVFRQHAEKLPQAVVHLHTPPESRFRRSR